MASESDLPRPRPVRRWATTNDAAAYIRVNPEVLRRWNREHHKHPWLPKPKRFGSNFRWDLDELDAALDSQADDRQDLKRKE